MASLLSSWATSVRVHVTTSSGWGCAPLPASTCSTNFSGVQMRSGAPKPCPRMASIERLQESMCIHALTFVECACAHTCAPLCDCTHVCANIFMQACAYAFSAPGNACMRKAPCVRVCGCIHACEYVCPSEHAKEHACVHVCLCVCPVCMHAHKRCLLTVHRSQQAG